MLESPRTAAVRRPPFRERRASASTRRLPALALAALSGCAAPPEVHDWSTYTGPGAEHFRRPEVELPRHRDPLEPFNREVFQVNGDLVTGVGEPVAQLYRAAVPTPARRGIGRFFDNLLAPGRALNNLLQGELSGAGVELRRFAWNTTVGVLGFRDVATRRGLARDEEDFGRTFQDWGWRDPAYLVLPFFGPSTSRDALGFVADTAADPLTYLRPATAVRWTNTASDLVPTLAEAWRTSYDPYELARLLYLLSRDAALAEDYEPAEERGADGATDTLGAVFLSPRDPEFGARGLELHVRHPETGRDVPFTLWLQEGAASVDYVIPGLGGHRASSSAVALAEAVFHEGQSAVTISSSMNHEFIASASTSAYPGFLPDDARDTHVLLDAIDRELRALYPGRILGRRVGGISFGGITTLFIAARAGETELVDFDAYLAVNAPLGLRHGARQLDAFYNAPLELPEAERREWMLALFAKTLRLAEQRLAPAGGELPFGPREARFLIGLLFRRTLQDVIYQTESRADTPRLRASLDPTRRRAAYREIAQFSLTEYVYAFVLPDLASRRGDVDFDESGAERLFELCDVRSIAAKLAANERVRFATNRNDFLLAPGDLQWVERLLGPDRVIVFERGGHLGNLHRDDIQAVLAAEVAEAAGESER